MTYNMNLLAEIASLKETIRQYEELLEISPYGDNKIDALEQALQFARHEIATQKQEIRELKDKIIKLTNAWINEGVGMKGDMTFKFVEGILQDENGQQTTLVDLLRFCDQNGLKVERNRETRQVYRQDLNPPHDFIKEPEEVLCDVIRIKEVC